MYSQRLLRLPWKEGKVLLCRPYFMEIPVVRRNRMPALATTHLENTVLKFAWTDDHSHTAGQAVTQDLWAIVIAAKANLWHVE